MSNGFFGKVKQTIDKTFGDETIRVVDDYEDEKEIKVKTPRVIPDPEPRKAKSVRAKKVRAPKAPRAPKVKTEKAPKEEEFDFYIPPTEDHFDMEDSEDISSAFNLDEVDSDFYDNAQHDYDKQQQEMNSGVPDLNPKDDRIQDVLEVSGIPPTFVIASGVLLPEDVADVFFDTQRPFGYEPGQVKQFVADVKKTINHYVKLLELRNEHVAELASIVDRLQVDAMNAKFANELNNGVSIMPTVDSEDVETDLFEAKLENRRLKDQISDLKNGDHLTSREREKHESLQNALSILRREKEQIEEDNHQLSIKLASFVEDEDNDDSGGESYDQSVKDDSFHLPAIEDFSFYDETRSPDDYGEESAFSQTGESFIEVMDEGFSSNDGYKYLQEETADDSAFYDAIDEWDAK